MDSGDRKGDDCEIRCDVQHGLGERHVFEALGGSRLERVAGPTGDGGQDERVDEDGHGDGNDDETVYARRRDAIEDGAHGHFCDGGCDQVCEGVGEQAFVEVDEVDRY